MPPAILKLGAGEARADAWLRQHWGVLDQPRHAALLEGCTAGKRLPGGHKPIVYGFFTEGPAPEPALRSLRAQWPELTLRLDRQDDW